MVFSTSKMAENLDEIYDKFFKSKHEMDEKEYHDIENRKKFVRALVRSYDTRVDVDVVGYYSVFPISRKLFDELRFGRFKESKITNDLVLDPDDGNARVLYVCEVCSVDRNSAIQLIYDLKKYISKLSRENSQIESVGAWGYTKDGRRLIEALGMKKVKSTRITKPYYEIGLR